MQHTTNYNLNLPQGSDNYNVGDFNENFQKIDQRMKTNADRVIGADFSTDEKEVGTWIDGKPLYQKTFVDNTEHNLEFEFNTGLTNIDTIYVAQPSFGVCSNSVIYPISYAMHTNTYSLGAFVRSNGASVGVRMGGGYDTTPFTKMVITLQYTKTTDEAPS